MLTEPIIDIIVYGFPKYLPTSLHNYVYVTTDYEGNVKLYVKQERTNISPLIENNSVIGLPIKQINTFIVNKNEVASSCLLSAKSETSISLLDTRDYFDWLLNADEAWNNDPDITNGEYIRGAGVTFGIYTRFEDEVNIIPLTSLNSKVGILFDWQKDSEETWADNPNITNQNYLQTTIN